MSHKFFSFIMGICVLIIFSFVLVRFAVAPEKSAEVTTATADQSATTTASSPTSADLLSDSVDLAYGEFSYEKLGDNHYSIETPLAAADIRPFSDRALMLMLGASSYFGSKDSDFTDSSITFVRKTGDFVVFYGGEQQGTSSVATIYKRTDSRSFDNDIKNIAIGNRFALELPQDSLAFTDAINKYCRVVENTSGDTERYNFVASDEIYGLAESEQMEYGPFLCGAGTYYVFDDFIIKANFVSDGIRVSDIKMQ